MMLKTFLTIGAVQVLTMLVLLVRTKILAIFLGPAYVGPLAVIDKLLAVIAQTISLSLPFAALRFLPERWGQGRAEYRALYLRMRNVALWLALIATGGALLVTQVRPSTWGADLLPYRDALVIAMLGLPVVVMAPFLQSAIAGRLQQNRAMLIALANAVLFALGAVWARWYGLRGYYGVYALLGTVLIVVGSRLATAGTAGVAPVSARVERTVVGLPTPVWRFSGALLTVAFLAPYAALFVHYEILSDQGAVAAGWMQAAMGIGLSVRGVLGTAHSVFLTPNVNRGGSAIERMEWADRFQLMFCLLAGLAAPPLLLFPGIAIHLLYAREFAPGAAFVMLFVLCEIVNLVSGTYQSLIIALNRMPFHVFSNVTAQLLVVVVASYLIAPLGILGAGLAVLAAPVFMFVATMTFLYRSFGLRMPAIVVLRVTWLLVSVIGAGLAGTTWHDTRLGALVIKAGIYAVIVTGFTVLLTPDERRRAREILRGLRARVARPGGGATPTT